MTLSGEVGSSTLSSAEGAGVMFACFIVFETWFNIAQAGFELDV